MEKQPPQMHSQDNLRGQTLNATIRHEFSGWMTSNRAGFLAAGFAIAAWAPIIPFIKERFALNEHGLGLLLLCVGGGSLFSSPLAGFLTSRLGCKIPIFGAAIVWAVCLVLISVLQQMSILVVVLFIFGMAAVILEVVSNINGAMIEKITSRTVMSGLHALYSAGGLLGSFGVTFILGSKSGVFTAALIAALFMLAIVMYFGRHLFTLQELTSSTPAPAADSVPTATAAPAPTAAAAPTATAADSACRSTHTAAAAVHENMLQKRYLLHPVILMISFMLFVLYLTEGAMLDWSGVFLYEERGMALEQAGYGYAAFAIMMTTMRFAGDRIVMRLGRRRVLVFGTVLICLGFTAAALLPHPALSIAGFALVGIGSSNVIPQLVSFVAKVEDVPMHISVTLVNSLGFTGVLLGPALIGFLAHLITLPLTLIVLGIFVLSVTALSYHLLRPRT